jgi:hypothetical protein
MGGGGEGGLGGGGVAIFEVEAEIAGDAVMARAAAASVTAGRSS